MKNPLKRSKTILFLTVILLIPLVGIYVFMIAPDAGPLVKLFEKQYLSVAGRAGSQKLDDEIRQYIISCCERETEAIKVLNDNGFSVKVVDEKIAVQRLNDHYRSSQLLLKQSDSSYEITEYDKFAFGKFSAIEWSKYIPIPVVYNVVLFIKDSNVKWVITSIERSAV